MGTRTAPAGPGEWQGAGGRALGCTLLLGEGAGLGGEEEEAARDGLLLSAARSCSGWTARAVCN